MPLYMRVPDPRGYHDIKTGYSYDNETDLRHSGDFPEKFFEIWTEKGKLFVQIKTTQTKREFMKTPNKGCFY